VSHLILNMCLDWVAVICRVLRPLTRIKIRAYKDGAGGETMDKLQFVYVTYIATTTEKIWKALTDPEITTKYWQHVNVKEVQKE